MNDFQRFLDDNIGAVDLKRIEMDVPQGEPYDVYSEIRDAIIFLRRHNHLTQTELASRTGMTQANISNLEKGVSKPTVETLKKIADATGTRLVIDFIDREDV